MKQPAQRIKARRLSTKEIYTEVKKAGPGVHSQFDVYLKNLVATLDNAAADGNDSLAGFSFAFAELANEITRRYNVKH